MQQNRRENPRCYGIVAVLILLSSLSASTVKADAREKPVPKPLLYAETALNLISAGDYPAAARQTRLALSSSPDESLLLILSGAILMHTGDWKAAQTRFERAAVNTPDEALAYYGLGLAQTANRQYAAALKSFDRSETLGGDRSCLLIVRRYAQWLNGAKLTMSGAGLPPELLSAQKALEGMTALQARNWKAAIEALEQAQAALPGDPTAQPDGLLMRFYPEAPIGTAEAELPPADRPYLGNDKESPVSGDILLTPEEIQPATAYVGYEMEGQTLGLVNQHPFQLVWNSRRATNGWHSIKAVLYDSNGREITAKVRRVRLMNPGASALGDIDSQRLSLLRGSLWQKLVLHPDRAVCAYALGTACKTQGNAMSARHWFLRAAAAEPNLSDVRRQYLAAGGSGIGEEALWTGLPTEKVVALTFDDGPKPGATEALLEILKQYQASATFFVIGRHVSANPELARKLIAAGMEIANHSYTHRNLKKMSGEDVARELLQTQAAVQTTTGKTPRYFRPPGGNWNETVMQTARRWGLTPCMWTCDLYNAEVIGAQQVAQDLLAQVKPGSILLMHNGKSSTLQALPTILRELRARGYTFVTVETMARRLRMAKAAAKEVWRSQNQPAPLRGE